MDVLQVCAANKDASNVYKATLSKDHSVLNVLNLCLDALNVIRKCNVIFVVAHHS